jgi:protein SCO1/2
VLSPTPPLQPPPHTSITEVARRPGRARLAPLVIVALIAVGGVAYWLRTPAPLPFLGTVPGFTLTTQTATPIAATDLRGHVWIADFVFTRCPDFCPALTTHMAALQQRVAAGSDPVRLVSFTVDPAHDTPPELAAYAGRFHAGAAWTFVTGPRDDLARLLRDGFRVAYADDGPPQSPITHSDRFVLVDRELRIRGYYHGTDPDDLARLARDAATLRAEKAS